MFGFIVGTLCLVGLIKVWKFGRSGGYGRFAGGFGRGGGRRRWMLRGIFERLDTTPGQEKVISEAFDAVEAKGQALRQELFGARTDFARAFRGEAFDSTAVKETFDRQQAALEELKKAVLAGLQSTHEALTPEQRAQVAQFIELGPRFGGGWRGAHGGRCGHGHHHGRFAHSGAVSL